eukprot:760003-Hanusia_phi.AAC.2
MTSLMCIQKRRMTTKFCAVSKSSLVVNNEAENALNDKSFAGQTSAEYGDEDESDSFIVRDTSKELFPKFPIRSISLPRPPRKQSGKTFSNLYGYSPRPNLRPAFCNLDQKQIFSNHASPLRTKFDLEDDDANVLPVKPGFNEPPVVFTERSSTNSFGASGRTSHNLTCRNAGASMLQEFSPRSSMDVQDEKDDVLERFSRFEGIEESEEYEMYPKYDRLELGNGAGTLRESEKGRKQSSLNTFIRGPQKNLASRKSLKKEWSIDEENINSPWTPPETPDNNTFDFRSNFDTE